MLSDCIQLNNVFQTTPKRLQDVLEKKKCLLGLLYQHNLEHLQGNAFGKLFSDRETQLITLLFVRKYTKQSSKLVLSLKK